MAEKNYYIQSFLAELDTIESPVKISTGDFLDTLEPDAAVTQSVRMIFLSDDLLQRESYAAGQIQDVLPAVLPVEVLRCEEPLPDFLLQDAASSSKIETDAVWENYFRHIEQNAQSLPGCGFILRWVAFEVTLRNSLVEARANALGLEPGDYFVADELSDPTIDLKQTVTEWLGVVADNPIDAQKILDRARWDWILQHGAYFSFRDDELVAYAAKLSIACRWKRLADEIEKKQQEGH